MTHPFLLVSVLGIYLEYFFENGVEVTVELLIYLQTGTLFKRIVYFDDSLE